MMDEYENSNSWVEISKPILVNNLQNFRTLTKLNDPIVNVQANALGYGVIPVIRALAAADVKGFAVSNLTEAIELRQWGTNKPILIRYPTPSAINLYQKYALIMPVYSFSELQTLINVNNNKPITVSLVFGFGDFKNLRLIQQAISFCQEHPNKLNYWGMQYFGKPHNQLIEPPISQQLQLLQENYGGIYYTKQQKQANLIAGSSVYGFVEKSKIQSPISLRCRIVQLQADPDSSKHWLATIPLGFGEGLSRDFTNFKVIIAGKIQAKIQQVHLDHTKLLVDTPFPVGTTVTLWGSEGAATITLNEAANFLKIRPFELSVQLDRQISRRLVANY